MGRSVDKLCFLPAGALALSMSAIGCGGGDPSGSPASSDETDIAPGSISKTFTVAAGNSSAALDVGKLAAGTTSFTAAAFNLACASVTAATVPDYVGSPVSVTVLPGAKPTVKLSLIPNVSTTVGWIP